MGKIGAYIQRKLVLLFVRKAVLGLGSWRFCLFAKLFLSLGTGNKNTRLSLKGCLYSVGFDAFVYHEG